MLRCPACEALTEFRTPSTLKNSNSGGGGGGGSGEAVAGSGCFKDAKEARVLNGTPMVKDENMTHEVRGPSDRPAQ